MSDKSEPAAPPTAEASASESAGASSALDVREVDSWEAVAAMVPELDDLAEDALEPSPSAEAWMLAPAMRYLSPGPSVRVAVVRDDDPRRPGQRRLCGVFPIEVRGRYRGMPVRTLRLWDHMYSMGPQPLLRRDRAHDCLRAFLAWAGTVRPAFTLVEFPNVRTDSPFFAVLADVIRGDRIVFNTADMYARAFFRPARSAQEYLDSIGSKHSRREWHRHGRRLAESGSLRFQALEPGGDVAAWVEEFVGLEMAGWKGREGTAFGCDPRHRAFLAEVVAMAQHRGRLMMLAMRLDGKPVAMKINFLSRPGAHTFKIAFDESYGKYTPGTLLELENIRRLHEMPGVAWADSLAAPNHSLMDRVWRDRATFATVLVTPRRVAGELLVAALPLLRLLRQRLSRVRTSNE